MPNHSPAAVASAMLDGVTTSLTGDLNLGHVLAAAEIEPRDVVMLRHTYTPGGLTPGALTPQAVLDYTRVQGVAYENRGELTDRPRLRRPGADLR
ncbi:hypothetical protein [Nocardioides malaquae]|uniref:hypothetical protein n=1 Tax=Nocardioides malaquae TaxID=2773426 RepID=UPI001D0D7B17|nr:hypothetical protein [Nocardioides malaquae]